MEQLRHFKVQQIVVSPFLRCIQTAETVRDGLDLPENAVELDWHICEAR